MESKLLIIFACCVVAAVARVELHCDYEIHHGFYSCRGSLITSRTDFLVDGISGRHLPGKGNSDVNTIVITNSSLSAMPKHLTYWFPSFDRFVIIGANNLPTFNRSQFDEMTALRSLYVASLPLIKTIKKDTFWDLTRLEEFHLDRMINLGYLDADLLLNMRRLREFTVIGPNKITQIVPGFFRHQQNTLQSVNFQHTNLVKIGYTVFERLTVLDFAGFDGAGCLNKVYTSNAAMAVTSAIRAHCQNVVARDNNRIDKKRKNPRDLTSSSSSSSSSSDSTSSSSSSSDSTSSSSSSESH